MSNVADSMSVEAQVKRLWKWVGELSIENSEMKRQIDLLHDEIEALKEAP
jgi:cell division protein FtsB